MKRIMLISLLLASAAASAQDNGGKFKVYGNIDNQVIWHSREGIYDESGIFYLLPVDKNLNEVKMDLNNYTQKLNFLNLASNAGVSWTGWREGRISLEARVDGKLYCNAGNGITLRLQNAYFNAAFDFGKAGILNLSAGQKLHPLAEGAPHSFSISSGAPFNPYSFAPQFRLEYKFLPWMSLDAAVLWQSYSHSIGPDGWSGQYLGNACIPEFYAGLKFGISGFAASLGADCLSIKPRNFTIYPYTEVVVPADDRITTVSPFIYLGYEGKNWSVRAKSVLASAGEYLTLMGGYAAHSKDEYGSYAYTPYRSSSSWISGEYRFFGFSAGLMLGYIQNLGTTDTVYNSEGIYYSNGVCNLLRAGRIAPVIKYSYKHLCAGLGYECTAAQYGDSSKILKANGLSEGNKNLVTDHCISFMFGCRF